MSVLKPVTEPLTEGVHPLPAVLTQKFTFGWKIHKDYKTYGNYLELPLCLESSALLVKYFEILIENAHESLAELGFDDVDTVTFLLKRVVDEPDPLQP